LKHSEYYEEETKEFTNEKIIQTQLTAVISILTILVACSIIAPIMARTEERKYMALQFFFLLSKAKINEFIETVQKIQKKEEEGVPLVTADSAKEVTTEH